MIIAACYDNTDGTVFGHFGRTEFFKIYTVENGAVKDAEIVSTEGTGGHEALGPFLRNLGVEALIAGGCGQGARIALAQCGIQVFPGVAGSADKAAEAFAAGTLSYNADAGCCHHHEEGHQCHHGEEGHHCHHGGEGHCHH